MAVQDLRVMGRATQGVKLINLKGKDSIAAVAKVMHDEEEVELDEDGNVIIPEATDTEGQNEDGTTLDNDSEE